MASLASGNPSRGPLKWNQRHGKTTFEALWDEFDQYHVLFVATRILKGHFPDCSSAILWLEKQEPTNTVLVNGVVANWDGVVFPKVSMEYFLKSIPDDWTNPRLVLPQKRGLMRRLAGLAHKLQSHNGDKEFPLHQPALEAALGVTQQAVSLSLQHLVNIGWITRPPEKRKDSNKCSYPRWWYRCPHP